MIVACVCKKCLAEHAKYDACFQRIALEVETNKLCSSVQQLQQELDNKNKAITMVKREVSVK